MEMFRKMLALPFVATGLFLLEIAYWISKVDRRIEWDNQNK